MSVNFQGNPDRHEQILAAVSPEAERLEARPDSETELSNPAKQNHEDLPIQEGTASPPDFFNTFWFAGLVVIVFLVAVWLT